MPGEQAGGLSERARLLLHQAPATKTRGLPPPSSGLSLNSLPAPGELGWLGKVTLRALPSLLRVPLVFLLATVYLSTIVFVFYQ